MMPLPLHAVPLGPGTPWWSSWHFEPGITAVLVPSVVGYLLCLRVVRARGRGRAGAAGEARGANRRALAFILGQAALAFALMGPLDTYNDSSFSLHMLQHLTLVQVAAPLIILGRPWQVVLQALPAPAIGRLLRPVLRRRLGQVAWRTLTHPVSAFLLFNASLVLWHWPPFYVAALADARLHGLEHLCFLGSALLFWWLLLTPAPHRPPISAQAQFLMYFATGMIGDVVAAGLTLATRVLYAPYAASVGWGGRPALADQQLGGAIMWVSGGMFFVLMFSVLLRVLRASTDPGADAPPARRLT